VHPDLLVLMLPPRCSFPKRYFASGKDLKDLKDVKDEVDSVDEADMGKEGKTAQGAPSLPPFEGGGAKRRGM
jgi:hypothetical protein